jgi:hypothetical protein
MNENENNSDFKIGQVCSKYVHKECLFYTVWD